MRARRLTLRRETLTELAAEELASLYGAARALPTKPLDDCYSKYGTPLPTNSPMCIQEP